MNFSPEVDPVYYFDEQHRSAKHNRLNPHSRSSADTLTVMEKHFKRIGLSRVVDLTGLDRLDMPVFNAVRPGIINYSVQHGKGIRPEDAKLSAIMESFERYYWTSTEMPSFQATYEGAAREHAMIPYDLLPQARGGIFHRNMPIDWTLGYDIANREPVAVPLELVSLLPQFSYRRLPLFQVSSNGLAAATNLAEAVSQALLELIERDAVTCDHFRSRAAGKGEPFDLIDWQSLDHPVISPLLEAIDSADLIPLLYSCKSDTRLPVYNCYLLDRHNLHEGFCHGMGAGMDEATAIIRAVTEAVQARAVIRTGIRDTIFHNEALFFSLSSSMQLFENSGRSNLGRKITALADYSTDSFEEDIHVCLERLSDIGLNQAIVFRFTPEDIDFAVVRVLVPGLEGYMLPLYSPGPRVKAVLKEKQQ